MSSESQTKTQLEGEMILTEIVPIFFFIKKNYPKQHMLLLMWVAPFLDLVHSCYMVPNVYHWIKFHSNLNDTNHWIYNKHR